jgi:hypothetical protein
MNESSDCDEKASRLLAQAGFTVPVTLIPLAGGANSKAFRVEFGPGTPPLFFKEYFHHPDDPRDRLGTEFSFASFAWGCGLRTLAQPHASDRAGRCSLFSYLPGRKLEREEVSRELVGQCLNFLDGINRYKETPEAKTLPVVSEGCFSLHDHWRCLQRRLARFEKVPCSTALDREALCFVHGALIPACSAYLGAAQDIAARLGIDPTEPIAVADRCLSPSDFGFHNTLLGQDGVLHFLDFEYAGWDDPAKTVCDFFCQPACPVPEQFYTEFAGRVAAGTADPAWHRKRFDLLLPMYRLKWCCILLNDFLPGDGSRRRFADRQTDESIRKTNQLHKARQALSRYWEETPAQGA